MSSEERPPELQMERYQQLGFLAVMEGLVGGTTTERSRGWEQQVDRRPADCDCLPTFEDLPCWPCYRDGFRMPNPDAKSDG